MILKKAFQFILHRTSLQRNNSKIFILPTVIGMYYFLTAILQLIIGVIFSNNLILLFGLILLIVGILTAVITNFHLDNIIISDVQFPPGHQDNNLTYTISVKNRLEKLNLSGINIDIITNKKKKLELNGLSLNPGIQIVFGKNTLERGKHELTHLRISTSYPLNLFQSWKNKRLDRKFIYVFPKRKRDLPIPNFLKEVEHTKGKRFPSSEFSRIEKHQHGDPHNRIDWKVYARTGEFYKKIYEDHVTGQYNFILKKPIHEEKLSEISSLISTAYEQGNRWEFQDEKKQFMMNSGKKHYLACQFYLSTREINE